MKQIYFDTAAATPLDPKVGKIMAEVAQKNWPNPSSLHAGGVAAAKALALARQEIAAVINARPAEIIFTSGGTEANNLAVLGVPEGEIIVSAIEHSSVLAPAARRAGAVRVLPVLSNGLVNLPILKTLLNKNTVLVSIMYANNEIGTIQPIKEIAKIIRAHRAKFNTALPYFHIDACQAARFLDLNVQSLGVDLMTINGGKIYGPKGAGLLYVRKGVNLAPLIYGGGQEDGRRGGTENVPAATGLAAALRLANKLKNTESKKLIALRDYAVKKIQTEIKEAVLNGDPVLRLPNNLNFSFSGVWGEQLVLELDAVGIAASTGSACAIPKHDDSYVILALKKGREVARGAVRFTFGREIKKTDLDYLVKQLKIIIPKLRFAHHAYAADPVL